MTFQALHELPRAFSRLTGLRKLWLRDNALTAFPQQLCALEQLATLDLEGNGITALPRAVAHMPALEELRLEGNPLSYPPAGILSQGPEALIEFIRDYRHSSMARMAGLAGPQLATAASSEGASCFPAALHAQEGPPSHAACFHQQGGCHEAGPKLPSSLRWTIRRWRRAPSS